MEQERQQAERRQLVEQGDRQRQQGRAVRVADVGAGEAQAVGDPVVRIAVHEAVGEIEVARHQAWGEEQQVEQAERRQGEKKGVPPAEDD